uniref:Uncharacterized protein n=1 Tax=Meloidogyne enterolobii TaxID=390850 RepID=A0A6V7TR44_MELEN|nr:unnamed protein product [Meloidogyne enterolobii]
MLACSGNEFVHRLGGIIFLIRYADDFSKTVEASRLQAEQFVPKFDLGTYQNAATSSVVH